MKTEIYKENGDPFIGHVHRYFRIVLNKWYSIVVSLQPEVIIIVMLCSHNIHITNLNRNPNLILIPNLTKPKTK